MIYCVSACTHTHTHTHTHTYGGVIKFLTMQLSSQQIANETIPYMTQISSLVTTVVVAV